MSLLSIRFVATRTASGPVVEAHTIARVQPRTDAYQRVVRQQVTADPDGRHDDWVDWFGNNVTAFGVRQTHTELTLTMDAIVETRPRPTLLEGVGMAATRAMTFRNEYAEYLAGSDEIRWGPGFGTAVRTAMGDASTDVAELVVAVIALVDGQLEVHAEQAVARAKVLEIWESGSATADEYLHVMIAVCRVLGVPARHVVGLHVDTDEDEWAGTLRSWIQVAVPDHGWVGVDPATSTATGEDHVALAIGRDAVDVVSLRTSWIGPAEHELTVAASARRLRES